MNIESIKEVIKEHGGFYDWYYEKHHKDGLTLNFDDLPFKVQLYICIIDDQIPATISRSMNIKKRRITYFREKYDITWNNNQRFHKFLIEENLIEKVKHDLDLAFQWIEIDY